MTTANTDRTNALRILLTIAVPLLSILAVLGWESRAWHYLFAVTHLEPRWAELDPQTREEFEAITCCTRSREVTPSQSEWGSQRVLAPGERMIQYGIFGAFDMPFEVVYDRDGNLIDRYTSYE